MTAHDSVAVTGQQRTLDGLIVQPGVYDIPADQYHLDPVAGGSISSTGVRKMVAPSCPALFKWWADHPEERETKTAFDYGQAAHAEVLGEGRPVEVLDYRDYKTKAAQAAQAAAYAAGKIPVLTHQYAKVQAMAQALRDHPRASALLDPEHGKPERSLVWRDEQTGEACRAMLDWLPNTPPDGGRLIVPDYKTAISVEPAELHKAMDRHNLHQQAAWNLDGIRSLGLHGTIDPAFMFIFQMKEPPHLVTVAQPDPDAFLWGQRLNRYGLDRYADCRATNTWPGYTDNIVDLSLPVWTQRDLEDMYEAGLLTHRRTRKAAHRDDH